MTAHRPDMPRLVGLETQTSLTLLLPRFTLPLADSLARADARTTARKAQKPTPPAGGTDG